MTKLKKFTIGVFVFLALVIILIVAISDSPDSQKKSEQTEMKLSVRVDVLEKAPAMYVKNNNEFDWTDCTVKLNSDFVRKIDTIYSEKSEFWTATGSKTNEHRVALVWFTDKKGQTFQVPQYVPKGVFISCDKPEFGYWAGKFNF